MAEYTQKEGAGTLFKNRYKEKDSQPDERGDAMIGGILYEVAAWIKTDRNGNQFRSLNIKPKRERPQADSGAAYRSAKDEQIPKGGYQKHDLDDFDAPF